MSENELAEYISQGFRRAEVVEVRCPLHGSYRILDHSDELMRRCPDCSLMRQARRIKSRVVLTRLPLPITEKVMGRLSQRALRGLLLDD